MTDTAEGLHVLDIRERRFRLQQAIGKTEDPEQISAYEAQIEDLRANCPCPRDDDGTVRPIHYEEDAVNYLWRCRDCDLKGELPKPPEEEGDDEDEAATEAAE